ncbi:hypothetical protein P262_02867 [Cronobacter malonaticus]|uniref:Uncharacterized protein n=1 Tax=Cronobacter malonaticus TaxID=413503 RepID=V5TZ41_9ENTR|nr:hypothetical protein P262_02867 [Cronobacter malonaticus]
MIAVKRLAGGWLFIIDLMNSYLTALNERGLSGGRKVYLYRDIIACVLSKGFN